MVGSNKRGIAGVPRVPGGMIPRHALRDRLGRTPLTVVRAPGGSGKTVLLAQWAAEHRGTGTWLTVEPDIGGRAAFWNAVFDGLAGVRAAFDDADGTGLRRGLISIVRGLGDFALVVDDAHELRDPLVEDDLLALLRACPGLLVLVGTRTRGGLEAPRHELTLDVTVLDPESLVLGLEEIGVIAGASSPRAAADLLEASGGNPLLLRTLLAGSRADPAAPISAHDTLSDHLRHLFAARDPELGAFASLTAIPDDVDATLAAHLSSLPVERVVGLLAELEREGLVMRREAAGETRHRYHPLVREVLRDGLRRDHAELARRAGLLASAAAESRGQYLAALRHAVDAEDYGRASDVVLHGGIPLLRSGGAVAILQRVPLRYVARLPFLAVVLGLGANARGDRLRALELLTLALGASRALRTRQRVAERVGLALIESVILRITGRGDDSAEAARRMAKLLEDAAPEDLEEIAEQESAFRYQGALSLFRAGRLDEARLAAERVGLSAEALASGTPEAIGSAALVAAIDAAVGDGAAVRTLERIDDAGYPPELAEGYVGSLALVARAVLALDEGDAESAETHLEPLRDRENLEHRMLVVVLRAVLALWRGEPELGLRTLDELDAADGPRARVSAQDRRAAGAARALLHAAAGRIGAAHAAVRERGPADALGGVLTASLLLLEQRPDLAVERLAARTVVGGPRIEAAADLLLASASLQLGDDPVAELAVRRFAAVAELHGALSPLVLLPIDHREAVIRLAERVGIDSGMRARWSRMPAPLPLGASRVTLTPREAEVLSRLRTTSSLAQIAAALNVSGNTVKSQVRTLYRKLGVSTRDEALRLAYLQGLLGPRD